MKKNMTKSQEKGFRWLRQRCHDSNLHIDEYMQLSDSEKDQKLAMFTLKALNKSDKKYKPRALKTQLQNVCSYLGKSFNDDCWAETRIAYIKYITDTVDDDSRAFGANVVNGHIIQPTTNEINASEKYSIEELLHEGDDIPICYYQFSDWFSENSAEEDLLYLTTKFNAEDLAGLLYMVYTEIEEGPGAINCIWNLLVKNMNELNTDYSNEVQDIVNSFWE